MIALVLIAIALLLVIEAVRWHLRPEARRLRTIKKLGGDRWRSRQT